jgi:hypothetical protein
MRRRPGPVQEAIMAIITRERDRGLTEHSPPGRQLDAYMIAAELHPEDADDPERLDHHRRNVARALAALERRNLVRSFVPPARRVYY